MQIKWKIDQWEEIHWQIFRFLILADVDKYKFPEENPFADAEDTEEVSEDGKTRVASVGYKYRKWDLGSDFLIFKKKI